ncbi:hypothetical protein QCA50_013186 [Cerrena zonata]|uniref:BHLH domain-containing protein n=1 Tax=Cerrena zonata TaxID=2478898 RepID=A0AAW0FY66_9APHY
MNTALYTGTCNPPRRAKRARAGDAPAPSTITNSVLSTTQRRPQLLPKAPSNQSNAIPVDSSDDEEDEYDPDTSIPVPKRRGCKPGPLSRSARESQRKLNHSRIEKARRTKINETLSTLSDLVNDGDRKKAEPVAPEGKTGGKKSEKEFKLDVLVKAVDYMQELIARVKELESSRCSQCSSTAHNASPPSTSTVSGKRKRSIDDVEVIDVEHDAPAHDEYIGDDEKASSDKDDELEEIPPPQVPSSRRSSVHPSPRLPPIASWLPHPYVDPSCIAALRDPNTNSPQATSHLPSPPPSGSFRSTAPESIHTLPSLTLPGPVRPMDAPPIISRPSVSSRRMSIVSTGARSVLTSPSVSPTWTPEDEKHAASMLLQMSTSPSSSRSNSSMGIKSLSKQQVPTSAEKRTAPMTVQTPGSLLGM